MCNRTKAKGLLPAPYRQVESDTDWGQEEFVVGLSSKARKNAERKQRRADEREAGSHAQPPAGGNVAAAAGGPAAVAAPAGSNTATPFTSTTDEERSTPPAVDLAHYGLKTLAVMREPKWTFSWPAKTAWPKTPQQVVADFKICKSSAGLVKAREREAKYQAILGSTQEEDDPAHYASTQKLLTEVRAEVQTYTSQHVGGRAAIEDMQSKLQDLTRDESLRTEKYETSMSSAKGRYDTMEKLFEIQIQEIQRRQQLFRTARAEVVTAHSDDNAVRIERFTDIADVWKANIAEMESSQPTPMVPILNVPVVVLPPGEPEMSQEEKDYLLSVPWTPSDLPLTVPTPAEGEYQYWLSLAQRTQEWISTYACAPCTYLELMGEVKDPSACMGSLAAVIGMEYWTKLYGTRMVSAQDTVPCQLALVLQQALTRNRATAESHLGKTDSEKSMEKAKAAVKEHMAKPKRPAGKFTKRTVGK